jgi:hypothetical protein
MTRDYSDKALKDAALALYYHVAQLIKSGKTHQEIEALLVAQGVKPETAQMMLAKLDASRLNVTRRMGRRNMFIGGAIAFLGGVLIVGTAQSGGAGAVFAWLALFFGVAWVMWGFIQANQRGDKDAH